MKQEWVKVGKSLKLLKTTLTNQILNTPVKPHENRKKIWLASKTRQQ